MTAHEEIPHLLPDSPELHTNLPANPEKLRAADCFTAPLLTSIQLYDNIPKGLLTEKQPLFATARPADEMPEVLCRFYTAVGAALRRLLLYSYNFTVVFGA